MKLGSPGHDITVFERDDMRSVHGWGVTFGVDVLDELHRHDPVSAREVGRAAFRWTGQVVDIWGSHDPAPNRVRLQHQAAPTAGASWPPGHRIGVRIESGREITTPAQLPEADLIVASDGANSRIRLCSGIFQTSERLSVNKYVWLGTDKVFESFMYAFAQTDSGWVWAYALRHRRPNRAHSSLNARPKPGRAWDSTACRQKTALACLSSSSRANWTATGWRAGEGRRGCPVAELPDDQQPALA